MVLFRLISLRQTLTGLLNNLGGFLLSLEEGLYALRLLSSLLLVQYIEETTGYEWWTYHSKSDQSGKLRIISTYNHQLPSAA